MDRHIFPLVIQGDSNTVPELYVSKDLETGVLMFSLGAKWVAYWAEAGWCRAYVDFSLWNQLRESTSKRENHKHEPDANSENRQWDQGSQEPDSIREPREDEGSIGNRNLRNRDDSGRVDREKPSGGSGELSGGCDANSGQSRIRNGRDKAVIQAGKGEIRVSVDREGERVHIEFQEGSVFWSASHRSLTFFVSPETWADMAEVQP